MLDNTVKMRIAVEKRIIKSLAIALLKAGYLLRVHNGEEFAGPRRNSPKAILGDIMQTDYDFLYVFNKGESRYFAWIKLVYGNEGWDVVSDYTSNLEHIIDPIISDENLEKLF